MGKYQHDHHSYGVIKFLKSMIAICIIGALVEFSWAANESVLIPHLIRQNVPSWLVSMIYISNPVVGLWIQPWLGSWSDSMGKRIPFVLGLGITALLGLGIFLASAGSKDGLILTFLGFGIADTSFDCLLIPGRALLNDAFPHIQEESNSIFTAFQLSGRLVALWLGSSRWTLTGLNGLFEGIEAHFFAVVTLSVIFLILSITTTTCCVTDQPCPPKIPNNQTCHYQSINTNNEDQETIHTEEVCETTSNCSNDNHDKKRLFMVCTIQAVGWVGITAQSFFWTSIRGEKMGCSDLVIQGLVGIFVSTVLPYANQIFGTMQVWCASELSFHFLMIVVLYLPAHSILWVIVSALTGINYAVHATNGLLVASIMVNDSSKRATTIAMINNCLPVGQLVTATTGGILAQLLGNFEYTLFCYGTVGVILTSLAAVYLSFPPSSTTQSTTDETNHPAFV